MPCLKRLSFAIACVLWLPAAAYAQASLTGVVRDTSGAALPGVTVEATSPALIEKVRSVVTDGTGQYRIIELRPGTYTVTFKLPGFTSFVRSGLELSGTFTATVNADMRVGAVEETVMVSGATPIVDVQTVTSQRVLDKEILDVIPAGRNQSNFAMLVPGMTSATTDYGGTNNLVLATVSIHGSRVGDQRIMVDGMSVSATSSNGELSNFVPDMTSTQEVAVTYSSGSAEQAFGGVQMNLIPRAGGNRFSGSFFATAMNERFLGNNYTEELKLAGLTTPNSIKLIYDVNPGGGGPVIRNKLWFYSAARWQSTQTYRAGLYENKNAGNPARWDYDPGFSRRAYDPLIQKSANTRLTWQMTPRNKVAGSYESQYRVWEQLSPTIAPESATKYDFPRNDFMTASYTSTISSKLLLDARASNTVQGWRDRFPNGGSSLEFAKPLPDVYKSLIAVTDQGGFIPNLLYRGAGQTGLGPFIQVSGYIASAQASVSYVTGAHAFKVGVLDTWGVRNVDYKNIDASVRYRFNNGVPNQITLLATPYGFTNRLGSELGIFVQDKWTIRHLTLNVGLRYDSTTINFPEQHLGPGPLVPNRDITFPAMDFASWRDMSPRLAAVYDLFGTGKTAAKVSLGRYVIAERLTNQYTDLGNPVNALANSTTRSWNDRGGLGIDGDYIPQCDLTNPVANGECNGPIGNTRFGMSIPTTTIDPDILRGWNKRPDNWEFEAGIEHSLLPRLGLDFSYFRRSYGNLTITDNLAVSASDYDTYSITAPLDDRLPGGGGYVIDDLWNLNPTKVGQVDNYFTLVKNYGNQTEHWNGVDVTMNLRWKRGTFLQGGISTGRTTTDACDIADKVDSPSRRFCRVQGAFRTQLKLLGTYMVPKVGVQVAATYRGLPGAGITAAYVASNAMIQPSLGRPLSGGAQNATVALIESGTMYSPATSLVDLRLSKIVNFTGTRTALNVDVSNAFNSSGVTSLINTYGSAWQRPTGIHLARFAKFSVQFDF